MRRGLTTEWLDLPDSSPAQVDDDLEQIRWINLHCGGTRLVLHRLQQMLEEDGIRRGPVRILDVATGSADLPLAIVAWGRRRALQIQMVAIERNRRVLAAAARAVAAAAPAGPISLVRANVLALPVRRGAFDYALCSLFLHQLDEAAGVALLRALLGAARRGVLVNDLRRGMAHYAAAWALSRALTRNPITRNDAPASVRNAYTPSELSALGRASGAARVRLFRHTPFRAALVLRP